jgi:hypothetical protein
MDRIDAAMLAQKGLIDLPCGDAHLTASTVLHPPRPGALGRIAGPASQLEILMAKAQGWIDIDRRPMIDRDSALAAGGEVMFADGAVEIFRPKNLLA